MSDTLDRLTAALGDRYAIEREIGEGGMATVYLATDVRHERKVALKVLRPELAATMGPQRFLQEVRVTANLQHPHILPLFDSGEADGFLYYVMPYLEGESLRERIAKEGELPVAEAVKILTEVVDALAAAHALGVVHRDIKPDNVMLSGRHAVVTDFGVAKAVSEATGRHQLTTVGVALGTPTYMAPEQAAANEHIDHRADIYAVGAMAYELLAGRPPFTGTTPQQVLSAHVTEVPRDVTEHRAAVPPGLGAVIMRCLEKKPADRWQTAEELLTQLEAYATPTTGITPTQSVPTTTTAGVSPVGGGMPGRLKVGIPVAAVGVAAAIWFGVLGGPGGGAIAAAGGDGVERLVVLPLRNLTRDPELDVWGQLAADQMARATDQPRPVPVIPSSTVTDAIRGLGDGASTEAIAAAVGATHAFAGTIALTGDQMRLEVELLEVRSGERLRTLEPVVGPQAAADSLLAALAQRAAAAAVAHLDPGAPPWLADYSVPVSLVAYESYLEQMDLFCVVDYAGSIEAGKRAVERSPEYVPALNQMMIAYSNLGMNAEADSLIDLLQGLRERMTTMERLVLDWMVGARTGDPEMAERAGEDAFSVDPSGIGAILAWQAAWRRGRMSDAIVRLESFDGKDSCPWVGYWTQGPTPYHVLGRYEEELALARDGFRHYPARRSLMDIEARAFAGMGRVEAVDSVLDVMAGLPPQGTSDPHRRPMLAALELRAHGHFEPAERAFQRALDGYASLRPDQSRGNRGQTFYYSGRWADADTLFASLLSNSPDNIGYMGLRGASLARLGRREEALELSARLGRVTGPNLRGIQSAWQAIIAATLGDRDDAVRLMQEAFNSYTSYTTAIHREPAFDELWGYPPWDALMAPRD